MRGAALERDAEVLASDHRLDSVRRAAVVDMIALAREVAAEGKCRRLDYVNCVTAVLHARGRRVEMSNGTLAAYDLAHSAMNI